ncbi:MAG TPA: porin [Caulobacteraceae bacterium]|jgi:hypothetical protein|nr:porin [Caulobacteraceae bacterium]
MTVKTSLLRGVAYGSLIAVALGAAAHAAPAKKHHRAHHHHAAMMASPNADLAQEVAELRAEVGNLKGAVAQANANAQQSAQAAAAAQEQAQAASAQSQASADDIKRVPGIIDEDVKKSIPKPKPSWADNTSVHGTVFADLSHIKQTSNGTEQAPSGTGFDIKRMYIGIDHKFNDVFSANLTTDFQYSSGVSATELYVKKAYLQAKLSDALVIRAGSADLPWIPFVEDLYGYRYVENTLIDRTKFGTSADWGLHAGGKLGGGLFNYAVSVVDGAGYKAPGTGGANPTVGRSQRMDIEGRANLNWDGFVLGVGGYDGDLGKDVVGTVVHHHASRFDAVAAYVNPKWRAGVEYFSATNWNNVTTTATDKSSGESVWGSFKFMPEFGVFGRYDWVDPTKNSAPTKRDHYYNLGLSWEPAQIVDISLVYKRDNVTNGTLATSNGTIGGSHSGDYDEVGLFAQYKW